jgi:hypothetical protein
MESMKALRAHSPTYFAKIFLGVVAATIVYIFWLLLFYGSIRGVTCP